LPKLNPVRIFSGIIQLLICIFLIITATGCKIFLDVGDNFSRNFAEPVKIKNRIKDPISDKVKLSALWVGHATVLIQIYDKVILTDPFLTNNIAEALRRYVEPGIDINVLKQCDFIMISHSHMDHLNLGSLQILDKKFPNAKLIFPEGVEEFLPDYDFKFYKFKAPSLEGKKYIGEVKIIDSVKITSVRANHWGGRYGIDGKLWTDNGFCGYIIQYKDITVYYAGDTSYDKDFFKYLGNNYEIDLEIIPIIYCNDCPEINKNLDHLYPKGSLKILDDTNAKIMFPVHYGTFTDPNVQYPVMEKMLITNETYRDKVRILKLGEQLVLDF